MMVFITTLILPTLLLASSIAPVSANVPFSIRRDGQLRARNTTWIYTERTHRSPSEAGKESWNDEKLPNNLGKPTSAAPSQTFKIEGPSVSMPPSGVSNAGCPAFSGNITVNSYQLYPEHADFNREKCLVYLSALYNTSIAVYDPYKDQIVDNIDLPGMSGDPVLHLSGVIVDPQGLLSVIVDAGAAFDTEGQDISGDNFLVKLDTSSAEVLWRKNLTEVTNGVYGGYQDAVHDAYGNIFVLGTFPSSIIKVNANGSIAIPWYLQPHANHTVHGLTGLASSGDILLATDASDGQLYQFNVTEELGHRVRVHLQGNQTSIGSGSDGILLPSQFNGTVLLVSDNTDGTFVLRSTDGFWTSAEVLGVVPNIYGSQNGSTVDSLEIGGSLYSVIEWFRDDKVPGSLAGNRTQFPLVDITNDVLALLN